MKKLLAGAAALISVLLPLFAFEGSPVADAAANRDFAAVKTLIEQKADVNAAQADGSTALHWAVYWNNAEAVDLLLKAGADTKAATRLNATPLYVAAENGNAVMIQKLLAACAAPRRWDAPRQVAPELNELLTEAKQVAFHLSDALTLRYFSHIYERPQSTRAI